MNSDTKNAMVYTSFYAGLALFMSLWCSLGIKYLVRLFDVRLGYWTIYAWCSGISVAAICLIVAIYLFSHRRKPGRLSPSVQPDRLTHFY